MHATFTQPDGKPVLIHIDAIDAVQPIDANTVITLSSGVRITVTESFDMIAEMLNPERQAGG